MTVTLNDWSPPEHPRDRRGRFTESGSSLMDDDDNVELAGILDEFVPRHFQDGADADAYLDDYSQDYSADQLGALHDYTEGNNSERVNAALRSSGQPAPDLDDMIDNLRSMMRPTPDDLVLNRTVSERAFGEALEDLPGTKVRDAGFSSTSLGVSYGDSGKVQMRIAAPAGTPAIFAAPHTGHAAEREVILGAGLELGVTSVERDDDGTGYNMTLVALPSEQREPSADELADHYRDSVDMSPAERQAVLAYTASGYSDINDELRYGAADEDFYEDDPGRPSHEELLSRIDTLNGLMSRYQTPESVTVSRGFHAPQGFPESNLTGQTYEAAGFQSTAIGEVHERYSLKGVQMTITVPKGSNAIVVNGTGEGVADENEMILPHNTRYAVTSDVTKEGKRMITATALPPT